jgi:ferredoxin
VFSLGEEDAYVAGIFKVQTLVTIVAECTGTCRACEVCGGKCLAGAIVFEE